MLDQDVLKEIYERFDPDRPAFKKEWRADRPLSPAGRIARRLNAKLEEHRFLLVGTVGTGKSTELLRIAESRAQHEFVVLLDLVRHFGEVVCDMQALQKVSAWEVSFLAGLAVLRATEQQFGHRWDRTLVKNLLKCWQAVAATAQPGGTPPPRIDLPSAARSMILLVSDLAAQSAPGMSAGLKLLEGAAGAIKWNLPIGLPRARALDDQHGLVRDLLDSVNAILESFEKEYRRPLLLVIDGLDRIVEYERARALLIDSELIQRLKCHLVVSGPFVLRHHMGSAAIRRFRVETLVNEPVLDRKNPKKYGPGVTFFCDLFRHRVRDLGKEDLIEGAVLEQLAYYSGGRARDFVRLIRELIANVLEEESEKVTDDTVRAALDSQRRLLEMGLDRGRIDLLERVMADPDHQLPSDERVFELLSLWRLLPYPNESEWYYPHPLLTLSLLEPK